MKKENTPKCQLDFIKKVIVLITLPGMMGGASVSANQINIYSIKNIKTEDILLTSNKNEYQGLVSENTTWRDAHNVMEESNTEEADKTPVYRLFNPQTGEHFYTINKAELEELITYKNWVYEEISFYAPRTGQRPVYRFFKAGKVHRFTSNTQEKEQLLQRGWHLEGVAWYEEASQPVVEEEIVPPSTNEGSYATVGVPSGFQVLQYPAHIVQYPQTGSYPWGQCTWYTYYRAQELGIHFSPQMGNGGDWQYASEYEVSRTPSAGSALSFSPGEAGADPTYGHVAFVEQVRNDGSILISECNVQGLGELSYRTFTAEEAQHFHYIKGK